MKKTLLLLSLLALTVFGALFISHPADATPPSSAVSQDWRRDGGEEDEEDYRLRLAQQLQSSSAAGPQRRGFTHALLP
ncbi:MAG: hypothetical protein ACT4TC_03565 [Myxococcaceae bacterium]